MLYSAWDREINISLFFATFLYENEAPGLEQAAVFTMATTFKKGIFVHPPWVPNCIQKFEVGLKIFISHFPFDSYRDLFSNVFTILCVFQWTWLLKEICGVSYCRLISTATPMNTKKKEFASLFLWGKN